MIATLQIDTLEPAEPKRRRFPLLVLAVMIAIAMSLGIYFWPGGQEPRSASKGEGHLPFGPAEQAYVSMIQFENISLSRAENFIHQEVTTLSGELVNSGTRPLRDVELAIVFSDELEQVVLRENRSPFGTGSSPLAPGDRREFEISLEHIPSSWNMQVPQITISGIQFAAKKK
jgi:hypothetical protein